MNRGESALHWHAKQGGMGERGALWTEYGCVEYPRLTRLMQRASGDAEYLESYHVAGLANYYSSVAEAIQAMEGNP